MLEKIQELGDLVTREQISDLKKALGDDLYGLLDHAFDSETEDDAKDRIGVFVAAVKKSPVKMFKARSVLNDEQKAIIMGFLES